jgi:hypothetical protein
MKTAKKTTKRKRKALTLEHILKAWEICSGPGWINLSALAEKYENSQKESGAGTPAE